MAFGSWCGGALQQVVHELAAAPGTVRTTTSHTIGVPLLAELLRARPATATATDYAHAVVEQNVLGRETESGRKRVLRHLRELYLLDASFPEFAVLRSLAREHPADLPLLALVQAIARDEFLAASWPVLRGTREGDVLTSAAFVPELASSAVGVGVSAETVGKASRNVSASWAQSGHLVGRVKKVRRRVSATPTAAAFATLVAHLAGHRGAAVLATVWWEVLDVAEERRGELLQEAHRRHLLDVRAIGDVVQYDPAPLLGRVVQP